MSFISQERRLLQLNLQLDTKFRDVINSVAAVAKLYPVTSSTSSRKKPIRKIQQLQIGENDNHQSVPMEHPNEMCANNAVRSRSRGILTLENNRKLMPTEIPLKGKGTAKVLKNIGTPIAGSRATTPELVLIENDEVSDDDLDAPNEEAPIQENFRNIQYINSLDSISSLDDSSVVASSASLFKQRCSNVKTEKISTTKAQLEIDENRRKKLSSDSLIKFLKAKISILHQEMEASRKENSNQTARIAALRKENNELLNTQNTIVAQNKALEEGLHKQKDINSNSMCGLKQRVKEYNEVRRKLEESEKLVRQLTRVNVVLERRLTSMTEDLEGFKQKQQSDNNSMDDLVKSKDSEITLLEQKLQESEQGRETLIEEYKKQLLLVDNLKRQNQCLQQVKMLDFVEKDFTKILDWSKN